MTARPPQHRFFSSSADERNYLGELLEHFKSRNPTNPKNIEKYLDRFERLLKRAGSDDGSILLQTHWALLHEFHGNIRRAIFHRERDIKYVTRLLTKYGPAKTRIPMYSIDKASLIYGDPAPSMRTRSLKTEYPTRQRGPAIAALILAPISVALRFSASLLRPPRA